MKNIVVIGAGKGIGLSIVKQAIKKYKVFAVSRNETEELSSLTSDFIQLDSTQENLDALDALPEAIHGLVYCPGSINLKPFNRLSPKDFLNDYTQNVLGAVQTIQKLLPNLKKANGASIVLFSTVAVKLGMPFHASIAASKGAIEGLAKSLAAEFAGAQIRVNVIAPSLTNTPLAGPLLNSEEKIVAAGKRHPLLRVGESEDMANISLFLLGEESSWITGQIIGVDGGLGSTKV